MTADARSAGRLIYALTVSMVANACGSGQDRTDAVPFVPDGDTGAPPAFTICAACHGPDGAGTKLGPELLHPRRDQATWVVRNGREGRGFPGPMAAYPSATISDQQLTEILDWLSSPPRPSDGRGLYLDFCGNCHGADGRGGVVGQIAAGKSIATIVTKVRTGHGGQAYAVRTAYMPKFTTDDLSDVELQAIESFLGAR
jgi:ubiquinol-cytochrome c reductase cytochrome c subunit